TYQELDYSILVLPKLPVHERIEFIQSAISGA
ncbi:MAG: putative ATPase, partial [Granulosicoccus sp.]